MSEFKAWPKVPRLNRNCIATEKIDGTNAAVIVELLGEGVEFDAAAHSFDLIEPEERRPIAIVNVETKWFGVWAQSRKRLLRPGKQTDNFGFAAWVKDNALELAAVLGEGYHYGEWWGAGIQRAYGLTEQDKRFSLFNVGRWHDQQANGVGESACPTCCSVVPVLATGTMISAVAEGALGMLEDNGSFAAPGYDNPEGIVIYHTAARQSFKVTCEGDESPKGIYKGMHSKPKDAA